MAPTSKAAKRVLVKVSHRRHPQPEAESAWQKEIHRTRTSALPHFSLFVCSAEIEHLDIAQRQQIRHDGTSQAEIRHRRRYQCWPRTSRTTTHRSAAPTESNRE
jgi:hypothetical protein